MKTSVDKCSGEGCICQRRPKPALSIQIQNTIDGFGSNGYVIGGAFPPPAAGGAAMRMALARETDLVRMQRIQS